MGNIQDTQAVVDMLLKSTATFFYTVESETNLLIHQPDLKFWPIGTESVAIAFIDFLQGLCL